MSRKIFYTGLLLLMASTLTACKAGRQQSSEIPDTSMPDTSESGSYESVEGTQIKMIADNTEVVITLNDSRAAADLVEMLPLELTLIERNSFAAFPPQRKPQENMKSGILATGMPDRIWRYFMMIFVSRPL